MNSNQEAPRTSIRTSARSWTSIEENLDQATGLQHLVDGLAELSRIDRPEDVLPLLRRSPAFSNSYGGIISLSTRELAAGRYRITRQALGDLQDLERPVDTWSRRAEIPVHDSGFLRDIIDVGRPQLHHHLKVTDDPVLGDSITTFGSAMAIPLLDDGEPLNWVIFFERDPERIDLAELEQRMLSSNLMGGTVRLLRSRQETRAATEAMTSEINRIAEIHGSFMPRQLPAIEGWSLAGRFETSGVAGGDLWTARQLEDGRLALLVADASGHGPSAAVTAAMTHAVFHSVDCKDLEPGCVSARLNRYLARWQVAGAFVTAITGLLDPRTGELLFTRCGHPPALVRPADLLSESLIRRLDQIGDPPLGIIEELEFQTATCRIEPGDTLVLTTDGVLEARSPDGRMLGEQGVIKAMLECSGDAGCTLQRIEAAIHGFEGDRPADDDQTVVVLHRRESAT